MTDTPRPPGFDARFAWRLRVAAAGVIWGHSFVLIKIADRSLTPLQTTAGRVAAGALALGAAAAWRGERLPRDARLWGHLFVAGALQNSVPFTLFAVGELYTTSTVAAICNGTTALSTVIVAKVLVPADTSTRRQTAGVLTGFAGVLVVIGAWHGLRGSGLAGTLLCLAGATSYSLGMPYTRRYLSNRPEPLIALTTGQLLCATAQAGAAAAVTAGVPRSVTASSTAAVLVLGVLGTGVAFLLANSVIRSAGTRAASTITYVIPIVATAVGAVGLGEAVRWYQPAGAVIILAGVYLCQPRPAPARFS